jgi:hypothetical protein
LKTLGPPARLLARSLIDGTTSSRRAQPNSVSAIGHDTDQRGCPELVHPLADPRSIARVIPNCRQYPIDQGSAGIISRLALHIHLTPARNHYSYNHLKTTSPALSLAHKLDKSSHLAFYISLFA